MLVKNGLTDIHKDKLLVRANSLFAGMLGVTESEPTSEVLGRSI
jgi:hypothetical protein